MNNKDSVLCRKSLIPILCRVNSIIIVVSSIPEHFPSSLSLTQLHRHSLHILKRYFHPLHPILILILHKACQLLPQSYIREILNMGGNINHFTWHQNKWPLISNCDTGFSEMVCFSVTLPMQFTEKEKSRSSSGTSQHSCAHYVCW